MTREPFIIREWRGDKRTVYHQGVAWRQENRSSSGSGVVTREPFIIREWRGDKRTVHHQGVAW